MFRTLSYFIIQVYLLRLASNTTRMHFYTKALQLLKEVFILDATFYISVKTVHFMQT